VGGKARPAVTDAVASKVLVRGEAMPVPAGRADDFAWPRRTVAPFGKDPVVATTDLPMTPMVAERESAPTAALAEATAVAAAAPAAQPPRRIRAAEYQQPQYRPDFFPGWGLGAPPTGPESCLSGDARPCWSGLNHLNNPKETYPAQST
jgi:hypothetical protein